MKAKKVIGVLGGGQLGRMLALAGTPLGFQFKFFDPAPDACAQAVGALTSGNYDNEEALEAFASSCDVVTYEFENVPIHAAEVVSNKRPLFPPIKALQFSQDRIKEKNFFKSLAISTAPFEEISNQDQAQLKNKLLEVSNRLGFPFVLKTSRQGYDGKGQKVVRSGQDFEAASIQLANQDLIAEGFIRFDRELSCIGVRGREGEVKFYDLIENVHKDGILSTSRAPASKLKKELTLQAQEYVMKILVNLDYVGTLTLELFQVGNDLIANEMAPRVHNSGHWSIEGATTSQFENHIRAILGLPLGDTTCRGFSYMKNIIGAAPDFEQVQKFPQAKLHWYGKDPKPGRKLGHITLTSSNQSALEASVLELEKALSS